MALLLALGVTLLAGCIWFLATSILRKPPLPLSTRDRDLQAGDWYIHVGYVRERLGGVLPMGGNPGEMKELFEAATWQGRPALLRTMFVKSPRRKQFEMTRQSYKIHDENGELMTIAERKAGQVEWRTVVEHSSSGRLKFEVGAKQEEFARYSDGETIHFTNSVVGSEVVSTPAGRFTAWKIEVRSTTAGERLIGGRGEMISRKPREGRGTLWYVPQLGFEVRSEVKETEARVEMDATFELKETNVQPEAK